MNAGVTATMARMSITLHDTIDFTNACATDGSFAPRGEAGEGLAAWGVWHVVVSCLARRTRSAQWKKSLSVYVHLLVSIADVRGLDPY